jgi:hypothetical protein
MDLRQSCCFWKGILFNISCSEVWMQTHDAAIEAIKSNRSVILRLPCTLHRTASPATLSLTMHDETCIYTGWGPMPVHITLVNISHPFASRNCSVGMPFLKEICMITRPTLMLGASFFLLLMIEINITVAASFRTRLSHDRWI